MKQKMRFTIALFGMLCLAVLARGSVITGPDTVCVGSIGNYSATAPPNTHCQWSVTPQGNITSLNTIPAITILWGSTGVAIVTLQDIVDSSGAVFATFTLPVMIEPLPAPLISANVVVGCQQLVDTGKNTGRGGVVHILDDGSGCPKVCESSVVTYTAHGGVGDTYGWNVAGGTILAMGADTCTVLWGLAGAGSITVFDTSVYGCVGTKSICIDIIQKPHAHFYAMPDSTLDTISICLNTTVIFVDHSVDSAASPIISWYWDFGDGYTFTSASSTSLSHKYTTTTGAGFDTASLVVTNACGCTDTFRMYIQVLNDTGVTIVCPGVVCDSDTASYSLLPVPPCTKFNWSVWGGVIVDSSLGSTITVLWDSVDTSGFGYVIFNADSCMLPCPGITVIKVPVIQKHGHISGLKVVCTKEQYLYSMPEWPTTVFNWTETGTAVVSLWHNDQNNQIVMQTNGPGIVYLQCNYYNTLLGCGGVAYDTITVLSPDSILGPSKVCLKTKGIYSLGGGLTGVWTLTDPGGTSFIPITGTSYTTPTLTMVGTYMLTVTPGGASMFCPIPPFPIKVNPLPPSVDSLLGPDTTCFGTPTTYTAKNAIAGDIFEWAAVTGTCNFSSGDHTDATFTGGATATIMVWRETVDDPHCHSDTLTKIVHRPNVTLNITGATTVCPSTLYTYNAGYSDGETYNWQVFTADKGSIEVNGSETVGILWNNASGPAMIVLNVRKCDSVYADTLNVTIFAPPILGVSFTPNPVCRGQVCTATVTGSAGGAVDWDWGDGTVHGSGASTTHIYNTMISSNTSYNVVVTVRNPNGCPDTVTTNASVTVMPAPLAYITPAGPLYFCGTFSTTLFGDLTSGFGATDTLEWATVASGVTSFCLSPFPCATHPVSAVGNYYVIAIGPNGCRDTSNVVLVDTSCGGGGGGGGGSPCVLTPAGWVFIDTAIIACGSVHLHGSYSTSGLTAFSWVWTYPPTALGVSTTNTTLDCSFEFPGLYTFTYTVGLYDSGGDTCYITNDTTILVPIIPGTYHSVSCTGGTYHVTLLDRSDYFPGHWPTRYSWYVNGVYKGFTTPPSTFTLPMMPGAYALGMWVYYAPDSTIDSCWATDSVYLDTLPIAGFSFARPVTCAIDAAVQFTNTSIPGSGLSYLWSFHDPSSTNSEGDPFKVFALAGTYPVSLQVTNEYGCTSIVTHPVQIIAPDLKGSLVGDSVACAGQVITLTYTPDVGFPHMPDSFAWMEGTSYLYSSHTPSINIYTAGSYWVHGADIYGCYYDTRAIPVDIIQVPPAVITGDHDACLNTPYTLNGWAGDDPSIQYQWYKFPPGISAGTTATITDPAAAVGTFTYYLIVSVPGPLPHTFCSDTSAPFTVTVHPLPPSPGITDTMENCLTYSLELAASGPPYGSYNWSNGDAGQLITVNAGGPYRCWYTDTFGCVSYGDLFVPKDPREYLWVFPSGCYNFCDTSMDTRYIVGPIQIFNYWAYQYAPLGPIVKQGFFTPVDSTIIPGPGDYDMVLDNGLCRDTSDILQISEHHCPRVVTECECLTYKNLTSYVTQCNPPKAGCCQWHIVMCVTNRCERINAQITVSGGTVTPPAIVIPTGTSCDTFIFHPTGSFGGGWVYFTITWFEANHPFSCTDSVFLQPCGGKSKPGGEESTVQSANTDPGLYLVPNPAQNSVRIDYMLGDASSGEIEVYDMTGRMVSKYAAANAEGSWQLSLDDFSAGLYLVILKENGKPVLQSKLSVIR